MTDTAPETHEDAPQPILTPSPDLPLAEQPGLVLAALTLIGEARGEPLIGRRAVLWVIRNRRRIAREFVKRRGRAHPLFGDGSLASCVLKKYQFSCWSLQDPNLQYLWEIIHSRGEKMGGAGGSWEDFYRLALAVEDEPEALDPTYGATHYCTVGLWNAPDTLAWYGNPEIEEGRTKETVTFAHHVFARVA